MHHIDPKLFRAFKAVDEAGSFSEAADLAAMTQANISKHIKALEEQINAELFVRTPKGPVITEAGTQLREYIKKFENLHSDLVFTIKNTAEQVQGVVSYAMPASCLLSPHFPMLLERRLDFPKLEINLSLMPTNQVFNLILDGAIDFGFVTQKVSHPRIEYLSFCKEEYVAVSAPSIPLEQLNAESLTQFNYIKYPGYELYFDLWKNHNFGQLDNINALSLHYAGNINSIDGAILMALGGLGVSIFPRHCIQHLLDEGRLVEWKSTDPKIEPVLNAIYIAYLKSNSKPYRVDLVISWFMDMVAHY